MKKSLTIGDRGLHAVKKALLIMKLTFLLVLAGVLQVSAKVNGQVKISLKLDRVEISKALNTIEKQGTYRFLYNSRLESIRQKINIDVSEVEIRDVLNQMFKGTDLAYKMLDNNLIVVVSNRLAVQDIKITGKITGDNGEPLSGVSITVKGTSRGTTTDNTGSFTLTVPEDGTLVISSIGFESKEVAIRSQSVINVRLTPANKVMDQVVVIGYGTASKRDLTGSIIKVEGKEVADKPNTNPVASLQSKVAGLYIVNNGTPGQQPDIRIRGTVSIGQVHPLYVVDGILQDNIDYLNPNDIESIEILKDPSSLAIFGVRGATGAIAITTKRAKAGQLAITLNQNVGFKQLVDKIKMADANLFNTLFAEENANNNVATPDYSFLTGNTDWIDAVTRTATFYNGNLSVSKSSDINRFNMGIGYVYDQGLIKHEQLSKIMGNVSDEVKITKNIKVGATVNFVRQHNPYDATSKLDDARKTMPQISTATKSFRVQNPYKPTTPDTIDVVAYSDVDRALQNSGVINPLLEIENTWNKTISYENRYVGNFYTEISFLKHFTFRPVWYADILNFDARKFSPLYYAYNPIDNTPVLYNTITSVTQSNYDIKKYQQDYILNYKNSFKDHNLTLTGGFTTYYYGIFKRDATAKQATADAQPILDDPRFWYVSNRFTDDAYNTTSSFQGEYTTVSWLARALYNYQGKYYLNGSFRDDASSRIPGKNRHQRFWAVGAAWEITKEDFMKNLSWLNFLKLKGSIGVLGNQTVYNQGFSAIDYLTNLSGNETGLITYYPFYPGIRAGTSVNFGNLYYNAILPDYQYNPDLKWETVDAFETGLEMSGFNNRLHFEFNYFNKTTKGMMTVINRSSLGLDNKIENGGQIRNWGEEVSATWNQNIQKDLNITIGGNITFLQNKVVSVAKDLPNGYILEVSTNNGAQRSISIPGYPIGSFQGFVVEGLYQSNLDILKSPPASSLGSYRPGDFKFKDVNGDGVIDANDRAIIGNPSPKFIYGGSVGVNFKNFSLGIDVGGVYGNDIFRTWGSLESPFQRVNYPAFKANRWHGEGTSNWEPIISQGDRFNYNGSTYNIEDGSYIRLRNVQIAYNFPTALIMKAKIKALRIYVNGQNLKTWKHNQGYTPEFGGNATAFGIDNAGGAIPRIITAGLNVTF